MIGERQFAEARRRAGFLMPEDLLALHGEQNAILDPFSTLVSEGVEIGRDNMLYPGVVLARHGESVLRIGSRNILFPGTLLVAEGGGSLIVGDGNHLGDGGCRMKANRGDARIVVGSHGRYVGGTEVVGRTTLGDGTQVLGAITVQDCVLTGGMPFTAPDPDARGAVLKGFGLARGIRLDVGEVVNGAGSFADCPVERQLSYHGRG